MIDDKEDNKNDVIIVKNDLEFEEKEEEEVEVISVTVGNEEPKRESAIV